MTDKQSSFPSLQEGKDFYQDERGRVVLTEAYHLKRGYCCHSGCRHCPYGIHEQKNYDPEIPMEWQLSDRQEQVGDGIDVEEDEEEENEE